MRHVILERLSMQVHLTASLFASLALAAGCASNSTQPLPGDVGHLEFRVSGARTVQFDVTAKNDQNAAADFAAAFHAQGYPNSSQTVLQISARDLRDSIHANRVFLQTPDVVPGRYAIGTDCAGGGPAVCGHVLIGLNDDYRDPGSGESFLLISGAIQLVSVQQNRVWGTFSGTARQIDLNAAGAFLEPPVVIQVRGGQFDVPISPTGL